MLSSLNNKTQDTGIYFIDKKKFVGILKPKTEYISFITH